MESQGSGSTTAEVRRLHIVYFLSRNGGGVEQPHLLRVHHHSRNGIRLRDVKRWLAELRGKDMPETFSWSYKRKYRTGYIWQDLLDDDLITPISDNEYVLKGSEISSPIINKDFSCLQKKIPMQKEPLSLEEVKGHKPSPIQIPSMDVSTKTPSEIEEESPLSSGSDTSTLTVESIKLDPNSEPEPELTKNPDMVKQEDMHSTNQEQQKCGPHGESRNENQSNKKDEKKINVKKEKTSSFTAKNNKSSSNSIFRNLMSCGNANDANDSAVMKMKMNRKNNNNNKPFLNMCSSDDNNVHSAEICKRDQFGGSQTHRIFGTSLNQQQCNGRKSCVGEKDARKQRTQTGAYKQIRGPNCSQCGKSFKPEKLHSHMKSCKGMKALANGANPTFSASIVQPTSQKTSSKETQNKDSLSGYYITD